MNSEDETLLMCKMCKYVKNEWHVETHPKTYFYLHF